MYLKTHDPSLNITDPYELTSDQLDAAVTLLEQQKPLLAKYWSLYTDEIDGFHDKSIVAGTAWPINLTLLEGHPGRRGDPERGRHGLGRHVDDLDERAAPQLHADVDEVRDAADVQAEVGVWYGAAGSNTQSCQLIAKSLGKGGREARELGRVLLLRQRQLPEQHLPLEDTAGELRRRPRIDL